MIYNLVEPITDDTTPLSKVQMIWMIEVTAAMLEVNRLFGHHDTQTVDRTLQIVIINEYRLVTIQERGIDDGRRTLGVTLGVQRSVSEVGATLV